jgi:hypothetical protein
MKTMKIELSDLDLERDQKTLEVEIQASSEGILLCPKGYEVFCGGSGIIMLQVYKGKLILNVWSDKEKEDPTHEISLEGAREAKENH